MENEEVLNQFGKMYIESVRDNSLHTLDNILNGGAKASSIKKLNEELKKSISYYRYHKTNSEDCDTDG